MRAIRDWFFSVFTVIAFGATMVGGDVMQRITYRMGMERYDRSIGALQKALVRTFRLSGVTLRADGLDRLRPSGGYIVVSNHQSMFDISAFGAVMAAHAPRFVSKKSLASGIPTVSMYLRRGGNALIDRSDRAQALDAIAEMGAMCQDRGVAAVIFPEGTRSRDGTLGEYRVAGLGALMEAAPDLEIVPAVIDGSWKVFRHNMFPVPYGTDVRMRFGDPIARSPGEDPAVVVAGCRAFAEATLEEWHRGQAAPH